MKFIIATLISAAASLAVAGVEINQAAPDFELKSSQGKTVKLSDQKGKWVVLEWFNNECPYVEKHYCTQNMQSLQNKFTEKGVVWLTLASSAPNKQGHMTPKQANKIIADRKALQTALLLDPSGQVGRLYDAKTTPHMFVINPEGKVYYHGAIDSDSSFKPSTIKGAKNYVDIALSEGLAGKKQASVSPQKPYGCSVKYASK